MTQTKIQGKFYPLKSEEWLNSINKLTHSELKILYYVRSLDPYNNGINLTPAQIAKDLSTENNKMHRSTVGRALKSLDRQGFINMELLQVRIKVNPKGFLAEEETTESKNVVATQHRVRPRNNWSLKPSQSKKFKTLRLLRLIQTLKTLSQKASAKIFLVLLKKRQKTSANQ